MSRERDSGSVGTTRAMRKQTLVEILEKAREVLEGEGAEDRLQSVIFVAVEEMEQGVRHGKLKISPASVVYGKEAMRNVVEVVDALLEKIAGNLQGAEKAREEFRKGKRVTYDS